MCNRLLAAALSCVWLATYCGLPAAAETTLPSQPEHGATSSNASPSLGGLEDVIPSVTINGNLVSSGVAMLRAGDDFLVQLDDLRLWQVHIDPAAIVLVGGKSYAGLRHLGFRDIVFDPAAQALTATLPEQRFELASDRQFAYSNVSEVPANAALTARSIGAFDANYTFTVDAAASNQSGVFGEVTTGYYVGPGELVSGLITSISPGDPGVRPFTRADTAYIVDDPSHLRRLTLGDGVTVADQTGAPLRFGGIQYGSSFDLDPHFVAFPLPGVRGTAYLPSTVQVYSNGLLIDTQHVGPGSFILPNLPLSGVGNAQVVIRDESGQVRQINEGYVASPSLLRKGVSQYSLSAGFAHIDDGTEGDRYGAFLAEASENYGLSDRATLLSHLEGGNGVTEASLETRLGIPNTGVFGLGYARSIGRSGGALIGDYDYELSSFGLQGHIVARSNGFELAGDRLTDYSDPIVGTSYSATANLRVARGTSALFTLGREDHAITGLTGFKLLQVEKNVHGNLMILGYEVTEASGAQAKQYQFDYSIPVGPARLDADAGIGDGAQSRLEYTDDTRNGRTGSLIDASLTTQDGTVPYFTVLEQRPLRSADVTYGLSAGAGTVGVQAGIAGSIVSGAGATIVAPPIGNSIVIVNAERPGVRVLINGFEVGRTDARGYLATSAVAPVVDNVVSIDPNDLPAGAIGDAVRHVAPPVHGVAYVDFPRIKGGAVTLRLERSDGGDIPAGSTVTIPGLKTPTGDDGLVFLSPVGPGVVHLHVDLGSHRACNADVDLEGDLAAVPDLGTVTCKMEKAEVVLGAGGGEALQK